MSKDLSQYRDKYLKGELNENDLSENPFVLFTEWFNEIEKYIVYFDNICRVLFPIIFFIIIGIIFRHKK